MGGIPAEVDEWILQAPPRPRPTEVFLPVSMEIAPVYAWQEERGVWCARIVVECLDVERDCEHHHDTQDEAWKCAEQMVRSLVEERLAR